MRIKDTTRGPAIWEVKAARVHLVNACEPPSRPTEREYWLIVGHNPATDETKYFISNAAANLELEVLLRAAFARWQVEKWFERA